jgi:hypothetical protein
LKKQKVISIAQQKKRTGLTIEAVKNSEWPQIEQVKKEGLSIAPLKKSKQLRDGFRPGKSVNKRKRERMNQKLQKPPVSASGFLPDVGSFGVPFGGLPVGSAVWGRK